SAYEGIDGNPAYVLFAHVFHQRQRFEIGVWGLTESLQYVVQQQSAGDCLETCPQTIAGLDPLSAARWLNVRLARHMQDWAASARSAPPVTTRCSATMAATGASRFSGSAPTTCHLFAGGSYSSKSPTTLRGG